MNSFEINKKRSFKVILNSYNTASFTPLIPSDSGVNLTRNVSYIVDFRQVIQDPNDFNKQYKVRCSFLSNIATQAETGIVPATRSYSLHVDLGKNINVASYRTPRKTSYLLPVVVVPFGASASTCFNGFALHDQDQEGVVVDNIRDISFIAVSILECSAGTPNSIDNNFTAGSAVLNYLMTLSFEEC